jgi:hypothetical protein
MLTSPLATRTMTMITQIAAATPQAMHSVMTSTWMMARFLWARFMACCFPFAKPPTLMLTDAGWIDY